MLFQFLDLSHGRAPIIARLSSGFCFQMHGQTDPGELANLRVPQCDPELMGHRCPACSRG